MRYCIRKLQVMDAKSDVDVIIRNGVINESGNKMKVVNKLLQQFKETNNLDYLMCAYTLDSPF